MENKQTVLIVDDEPLARDTLEGFLFREGYNLTFAANGPESLTLLETAAPDVILLDVMMPGMDGFEVCRRVKAVEQWRHVPIILVTALDDRTYMMQGIEAGADDFLTKPVNDLELRARVRSMLRIKRQFDSLQSTLSMREELARMIVHDMRTPLSSILGYSEWLQIAPGLTPEMLSKYLQSINTESQRLNDFLTDMLLLAKIEAGQPVLHVNQVDVERLVQQVARSHEIIAQSRGVELAVELPPETRPVTLDASLIERVLDNLISNALKFTPSESTVTVRLTYLSPLAGPKLRLQVLDQGPGIPDEHRERVFNKFEIVDMKQNNVAQIGLGLAFCKMVADAHGGHICVGPNEPQGSIFTVEI